MGEPAMEIGERELQKIGEYVKNHLAEWMQAVRSPRELDLIERAIRLEEGQKNLHQNMDLRFDTQQEYLEKHLGTQQHYMDKRFELHQQQMDRRFEAQQQQMDNRFAEQRQYMDSRFKSLQWFILIGFGLVSALIGVIDLL
jgi:hypothetical protein